MIFQICITLSAFLLFMLQPMVAKEILPVLGGSAQVWNTCIFFFQFVLFLGYAYAYLLQGKHRNKFLPVLHLVLLVAGITLAIYNRDLGAPYFSEPQLWMIGFLISSIGLAYFTLSAHSPLIQFWAHMTKKTKDPYRLYIYSNIGSLAGLLAYPFIIEPVFDLSQQWKIWIYSYVILTALIAYIVIVGVLGGKKLKKEKKTSEKSLPAKKYIEWIILAFLPSAVMLAVNTHVTTDIAPIPMIWVATLSIYLVTLILAFSSKAKALHPRAERATSTLIPMIIIIFIIKPVLISVYLLHLFCLFAICLLAHIKLAEKKPAPEKLTSFYLSLSFGGMLGGLFGNFIAPYLFSTEIEYLLLLFAAYLYLLPNKKIKNQRTALIVAVAAPILIALLYWFSIANQEFIEGLFPKDIENPFMKLILNPNKILTFLFFVVILAVLHVSKNNKYIFSSTMVVAFIFFAFIFSRSAGLDTIYSGRNFYGSLKVKYSSEHNIKFLMHGSTQHGYQFVDNPKKLTAYYASNPSDAVSVLRKKKDSLNVAIIGLGTGTQACAFSKNDNLDYYEINPMIIDIAKNPAYFTYLKICPPKINIIQGDGRLMLEKAAAGKYDLIIVDAFSSDAIPVHLLTDEAMKIYISKLKKTGIIQFHISNRYLSLSPVVAGLAAENGMKLLEKRSITDKDTLIYEWTALSADKGNIQAFLEEKDWKYYENPRKIMWTDKYTNIFSVLK